MATKKHPDVGYLGGLITESDVVVVIAASEKLESEGVSHAFLAIHKERAWKIFEEDFDLVSVSSGKGKFARHLVSLGMLGEVVINEPSAVLREAVHKGKNGPSSLRTMHEVRAIDQHFVAVGMRRQVYRRKISQGPWARFDVGVLLAEDSVDIAGFLSVDGFDDNEIYAVGYRGEIWQRDANQWLAIDSPTNARLECVRCGADGTVVACGDVGTVLRGRGSQWEVVPSDGVDTTLTSVAPFKGEWYVADEEGGLFVLGESGLEKVPGFPKQATTGRLSANANKLLSVGEEHIVLFDGKKWQVIDHPPIDPT